MKRNKLAAITILLVGLMVSGVAWAGGSHGFASHGSRGFASHGFRSFPSGGPHNGFHGHHHFHSRGSVGVIIGAPLFFPPYYAYPPPVALAPVSPPVYLEQGTVGAAPQAYWYYCNDPPGYYPQVNQCPGGWQQVPAQPSSVPAQP